MLIEIKDARKEYGYGDSLVKALDGVDLSLEEGKVYVVLGPSGSGKSTLLNMVGGLDVLTSGSIVVDGIDISKANKKEMTEYRRKIIGFVFQFYNLVPDLTALENIEVVSDISNKETNLNIDEIMESLEISDLKNRFPRELSGGQQQRIAIARALVKNPKILLCDELTGALDTKSSKSVLKVIEKVNQKYHTTIIIITHNEAIQGIADVIIRFKDGNVNSIINNENKITADELEL
ncbi:MAG: ABC transporter ATP-binding protein [Acholeplasmatales bacterium]|nr:ABC transporter ATP-binding protein [Acholeplasmatales bacterium]